MKSNNKLPLIVIVGPTACGKTKLAVELAERFGGEIICADSRTVFKEMNIGTAKPTSQQRSRVAHWGLDLVFPNQYFSVADFKIYSQQKIEEVRFRGNIPFLVGGTGLYIDAVIFDYHFGKKSNADERRILNDFNLEQLHDYCFNHRIELPENRNNKRYVIRAIECANSSISKNDFPMNNSIIVGITTDKVLLRNRIMQRVEQIFNDGVVDEAKLLGEKYGWECEAMKGNAYPIIHNYLMGNINFSDAKSQLYVTDWRLAKRQLTWLNRNRYIHWMSLDQSRDYLSDQLAMLD